MKKLQFFLTASLLSFVAFAQTEHQTFKGIPIDGTLSQFTSKLCSAGFELIDRRNNSTVLMGTFAGHSGVMLGVRRCDGVDLVYSVTVLFNKCTTWNDLEIEYKSLKRKLTTKYGEPTNEITTYKDITSDFSRLKSLELNQAICAAAFETKNGMVFLHPMYTNGTYRIVLEYYDSINEQFSRESDIDDL